MNAQLARRILEVSSAADAVELRQAYRDLIRVWHPDRFAADPRLRAKAERRTAELNCAFRFLIDSCDPRRGGIGTVPPGGVERRAPAAPKAVRVQRTSA